MGSKVPRLLLFDIDGTLTTFAYAQHMHGDSIMKALSQTFGRELHREGCVFAGGTDPSIADDVLSTNGITRQNCDNYDNLIKQAFEIFPGIVKDGIKNKICKWNALPNVPELLEALSRRDDVRVALLTGNLVSTAQLKLESAGLDIGHFRLPGSDELFGAFGSDDGVRSKLVEIARRRYSELHRVAIGSGDMVVVGDTPKDVACAHDNGVPCVAVTTGSFSKEELATADCVLEGFGDLAESIEAILTTRR